MDIHEIAYINGWCIDRFDDIILTPDQMAELAKKQRKNCQKALSAKQDIVIAHNHQDTYDNDCETVDNVIRFIWDIMYDLMDELKYITQHDFLTDEQFFSLIDNLTSYIKSVTLDECCQDENKDL